MTDARLAVDRRDGAVVVTLRGEIDLANVDDLRARIEAEVENAGWALVVDVSALDYLDSAGVRLMFELAARLAERRQELVIVAPRSATPSDVLRLVSIDSVARVVETSDDAVERVREMRRERSR